MFGGSKITLNKDLLARVKKFTEIAGYSSVEEFISHALTLKKRSKRSYKGLAISHKRPEGQLGYLN